MKTFLFECKMRKIVSCQNERRKKESTCETGISTFVSATQTPNIHTLPHQPE